MSVCTRSPPRLLRTALAIASEPLSTSSRPSPAERTTTLPGAPLMTLTRSVSFAVESALPGVEVEGVPALERAGVSWQPARPPSNGRHPSPASPVKELCRKRLRSDLTMCASNLAHEPGAVAELRHLDTDLVEDRQVQVGQRGARSGRDVLAADVLAVGAAHQDLRQRIVVVLVAVAHVRAVEEQRMIEDAAVAFLEARQLLQKVREALHVIALDDLQPPNALLVIGVMADGVEGIRHPDEIVGAVGAFGDHHERGDAREIRLIGQRQQVEHQANLLIEV